MGRLLLVLMLSTALAHGRARAAIRYDFEERIFQDPVATVADHAVVRRDSLYHLFYTRGPVGSLVPTLQRAFGHAVSTDLVHWTVVDTLLPVVPGTWENMAHWAPTVVERPAGVFNLLYTGVDSSWTQQIGLATSPDLFTWTPSPSNPVFHTDSAWADWHAGAYSNCRDPALVVSGDTVTMLVTALTDYGRGAIGSAVSTDLVNWTDTGPIALTPSGPTSWHQLEAVATSQFGGAWQLYYGETGLQGVRSASAPSLLGPWDLGTSSVVDYGAAAENTADGDTTWFSRHGSFTARDTTRTVIRFDLVGLVNGALQVTPASVLHANWTVSGSAFSLQPTFGDNTAARGLPSAGQQGNGWIGSAELFQPLIGGGPGVTQGNRPMGDLISHPFVVEGDSIALLVGGGNMPDSVFVALCDACTDSVIRRATGANLETMSRRAWETGSVRGQRAYLWIADHALGTWGHINVDDIEELGAPPEGVVAPAIRLLSPLAGETVIANTPVEIAWSVSGGDSSTGVAIDLSTNGGLTWSRRLATVPAADSSFTWLVDVIPTGLARVRLIAHTGGGVTFCDRDSGNVAIIGTYIDRVTAASVTDSSFTVFWTTVAPGDGAVEFGDTPALGETAVESGPLSQVHAVTLTGLADDRPYWFRVVSNGETADSAGAPWAARTTPFGWGEPYFVDGSLTLGGAPASGAAALVWLTHAGVEAWPLLAFADSSGSYSIDLGAARDPATGLPLPAVAGDTLRLLALLSPSQVNERAPIILTGSPPQSLDSTQLVTGVGDPARGAGRSPLVVLERVRPMPARDGVTLAFTLAIPERATVRVLDARGAVVRTLVSGPLGAGTYVARWDGRDAAGRPAPAGIYFAVASVRDDRAAARLVLLR